MWFYFNQNQFPEVMPYFLILRCPSVEVPISIHFFIAQSEDSPSPKRQRLSHSVFDYAAASPAPSPPMRPWEMTSNRQPPSARPSQHHFSGERCNTPARNRRRSAFLENSHSLDLESSVWSIKFISFRLMYKKLITPEFKAMES